MSELTKTRYSDEELSEFKLIIEDKIKRAEQDLKSYLEQIDELSDSSDAKTTNLSDGVTLIEVERLSTLASRQKKYIQHLKYALMRIDNKVYGVCRETGKLISKARLKAVPHATLSIAAKQSR